VFLVWGGRQRERASGNCGERGLGCTLRIGGEFIDNDLGGFGRSQGLRRLVKGSIPKHRGRGGIVAMERY
jgi:hypothetical protein